MKKIEIALAMIGGAVATALGGWDSGLKTLLIFMTVDYFSGLACGILNRSPKTEGGALSSFAGLVGLVKKGGILTVVLIAVSLDRLMGTTYARDTVILFFIGNEGLSIIENIGIIGVPLPPFIKKMLEIMKQKGENHAEKS